jgi:hypothetical protein
VHCVDKAKALPYAGFSEQSVYFSSDIDKFTGLFSIEPEFFGD